VPRNTAKDPPKTTIHLGVHPMIDPSKASGARIRAPRPLADAERLRQAIGTCGLGLWEWHVADDLCHIDPHGCELLRLPREVSLFPTRRFLRLVHRSDIPGLKESIRASFSSGCELSHEFRLRRRETGEIRWVALKSCIVERDDDGEPLVVAGLGFDVTTRRREQEARELLNQEFAHRMKNMLSVVGSIVTMSGEHRPEARDFVAAFQARLGSLAATHELLTQADGRPIALGRLFEKVLAPLGVLERIDAAGDREFLLGAHDAQTVALVMHELATNAIKYGALSNSAGRVALAFEVKIGERADEQPTLTLRWEEVGGPTIAVPVNRGFGLTLLERLTRRNEQMEPVFEWRAAGLYCCFSLRVISAGR
jgi:two-component sensor histidine kinase